MIVEIDLGVLTLELESCSLDELDAKVEVAMREKHKEAIVSWLKEHDALDDTTTTCPRCKEKMTSRGYVEKKLGTLSGEVLFKRRRLRCTSCSLERYPLDEVIGDRTKHTLPVIERALFLATELSYKKASEALKKLTGAKISHGQIQALAKKEGALVNSDLERMASDLFGMGLDPGEIVERTKDDTVVIAIDGGTIPDRATKSEFEAKVGVIYGIKAEVSKNRIALVDRVGYASLEPSFEFGKKLFCLARQHGVLSAGRVLAIADGAAWIKTLIDDFFPQAIYLLDLYHLKKRLKEVLYEEENQELYESICQACLRGSPHEALEFLLMFRPKTPEQEEKLRKLKGYIQANSTGITNYARTDLFGSGAVEKAVDLVVSRRFKNRGMSWLKPGAGGMLALRLLRFNGRWDEHWRSRMPAAFSTAT